MDTKKVAVTQYKPKICAMADMKQLPDESEQAEDDDLTDNKTLKYYITSLWVHSIYSRLVIKRGHTPNSDPRF